MRIERADLLSFILGCLLLVLELVGARILFTDFGCGIDVWAAVLTVFLGSMAIGYYLGGRLADRNPDQRGATIVLLGALVGIGFIACQGQSICHDLATAMPTWRGTVVLAAICLFALPTVAISMATPVLIRWRLRGIDPAQVATTTARVAVWGSVGSVVGVIGTDYLLLPHVSVGLILIAIMFALGVAAVILVSSENAEGVAPDSTLASKRWVRVSITSVCVALVMQLAITNRSPDHRIRGVGQAADEVVVDARTSAFTDSTWVVSKGLNEFQLRFFDRIEGGGRLKPTWGEISQLEAYRHLDPGGAASDAEQTSAKQSPGSVPSSVYISQLLIPLMLHRDSEHLRSRPWRILIVGLGSGIGPTYLAANLPASTIDVIEIDDRVTDLVRANYPLFRWLENRHQAPSITMRSGDARQVIRRSKDAYDYILIDAYTAGSSIPCHLMTAEFFAQCRARLAPDGIMAANIIGSYGGRGRRLLGSIVATMDGQGGARSWTVPVIPEQMKSFDRDRSRNVLVLTGSASGDRLSPAARPMQWQRLADYVPCPGMDQLETSHRFFVGEDRIGTSTVLIPDADMRAIGGDLDDWLSPVPAYQTKQSPFLAWSLRRDCPALQTIVDGNRSKAGWNRPINGIYRVEVSVLGQIRWGWKTSIAEAANTFFDPAIQLAAGGCFADAIVFTDAAPNADILQAGGQ